MEVKGTKCHLEPSDWLICQDALLLLSSRAHRGKGLAAFLKAIGYLIPLMDNESANYYTREVMVILIREFQSPDEEMKKIVLKVRWEGIYQAIGVLPR